ncbi:unnamed protein product [Lota lota]
MMDFSLVKGTPAIVRPMRFGLGQDRRNQPTDQKSVKQRLARVNPRVQLGPRPRRLNLDSGPLRGRFLGGRFCPCALWGLRLLSRRYGWAGKMLRARPLERAGFYPNRFRRRLAGGMGDTGTTSTSTNPRPVQTNTWQHAPEQGWKPHFKRKVVPTKEELDQQLDDYMSTSKKYLDAQLDAYMAMTGDLDGENDRKWYDVDGV